MQKRTFLFSSGRINYHTGSCRDINKVISRENTVIITDENVFDYHQKKFAGYETIVLKPGEEFKIQTTADAIIRQLIDMQAGRDITLVGLGGGVITDLTGYVASVYLRGVRFGFIPTTLLAMVDASIGGKNGIDIGDYKNMVGTIRQPSFLIQDADFLKTLPQKEWQNGFAEIIKHACIGNASLLNTLMGSSITQVKRDLPAFRKTIQWNAFFKMKLVQKDETEQGPRRLLNFGHTLGHAIENLYGLSHGEAVAIGMMYACRVSGKLNGFTGAGRLRDCLLKYRLPVDYTFDKDKTFEVLKRDKKRFGEVIHFILLEKIGKAVIQQVPIDQLYNLI